MKILSKLPRIRKATVATIGVFDGIHRGHSRLLRHLTASAERSGMASLLITFWPHPQALLNKHFYGCITDLNQKKKILKQYGIDYVLVLRSTKQLLRLKGEDFLANITKKVTIKKLIVGEDFRFGHRAQQGIRDHKRIAVQYGFSVTVIRKSKIQQRVVSSSLIRTLIMKGALKKVKTFLGRNYYLEARIKKGKGLGRKLGYPTLNLDPQGVVIPHPGVYVVGALLTHMLCVGLCNIGVAPTVSKTKQLKIEVHLLDYHPRALEKLGIVFLERIRDERRHTSLEKLSQSIGKDIRLVRLKYPSLSGDVLPWRVVGRC